MRFVAYEFFLFPIFKYLVKSAFSEGFQTVGLKKFINCNVSKRFFIFEFVFLLIWGIVTCELCYLGFG